jgi:hypothetical protein
MSGIVGVRGLVSFVPKDIVERVAASEKPLRPYDIQNRLKRAVRGENEMLEMSQLRTVRNVKPK